MDYVKGTKAEINGSGDLAMDGEVKGFIGSKCEVLSLLKSGLYLVRVSDTLPSVELIIAKKNLTVIGDWYEFSD